MKPPRVDLRYPKRHCSNENNLWLAVLMRTIQDCQLLTDDDPKPNTRARNREAAADAISCLNDPERYKPICRAAGLRPGWAMRKIRIAGYWRG